MRIHAKCVLGLAVFLSGCAGSASHDMLSTYQANDDTLPCREIDSEIIKAQMVIDGVNKDKEDLTAADITDGILWFPFNLIAKNGNYNDAIQAADKRIAHLHEVRKDKNCPTVVENNDKSIDPVEQLAKLKTLYESGALTEEEFNKAKKQFLAGM